MAIRVLIGCSKETSAKQLSGFLTESGYLVVGEAVEAYDLLRKVHSIYPDLVILDYHMKGMGGKEVAEVLITDGVCPVIMLVQQQEMEYLGSLVQDPDFSCVGKPINRGLLMQTIDILVKASRKIRKLEKQVEVLKEKLDTKDEIHKAKHLLIQYMNLTEEEAHRRIQKQSMDKGISKLQVARAIILTYDE